MGEINWRDVLSAGLGQGLAGARVNLSKLSANRNQ